MSNSKPYFTKYESPNIVIVPTVSCYSTSSAKKIQPTTHRRDDGNANCNVRHIETISESSRNNKYRTVNNINSWASNYLQSIGQPLTQNIQKTTLLKGTVSTHNLIHIMESKCTESSNFQHSSINETTINPEIKNNDIDKRVSSLLSSIIVPVNNNCNENKNKIKLNLLGKRKKENLQTQKCNIDSSVKNQSSTNSTSPKKRKLDTIDVRCYTTENNHIDTEPSPTQKSSKIMMTPITLHQNNDKTPKSNFFQTSSATKIKHTKKASCQSISETKPNDSDKHSKTSQRHLKHIETHSKKERKTLSNDSKKTFSKQLTTNSATEKTKTSTPVVLDDIQKKTKTTAHVKSVVQITDNFDLTVCSDDLRHKLKRKHRTNEEQRDNLIVTLPNCVDETNPKKSPIHNVHQISDGETRINIVINFIFEKPKDSQVNTNSGDKKEEDYSKTNVDISFLDDLNIDDIVESLNSSKKGLEKKYKSETDSNVTLENNNNLSKTEKSQTVAFNNQTTITVDSDILLKNNDTRNIDMYEEFSRNKIKSDLSLKDKISEAIADISTKHKTDQKETTECIESDNTITTTQTQTESTERIETDITITTTQTQTETLIYNDQLPENITDTQKNVEKDNILSISKSSHFKDAMFTDELNISNENIDCKSEVLQSTSLSGENLCTPLPNDKESCFCDNDKKATNIKISKDTSKLLSDDDTIIDIATEVIAIKNTTSLNVSNSSFTSLIITTDSEQGKLLHKLENDRDSKQNIVLVTKTVNNEYPTEGFNTSHSNENVILETEKNQLKLPQLGIEKITLPGDRKETNCNAIDFKTYKEGESESSNLNKNIAKNDISINPKILVKSVISSSAVEELSNEKNSCLSNELDIKTANNFENSKKNIIDIEQTCKESMISHNKIPNVNESISETENKSASSVCVGTRQLLNKDMKSLELSVSKNKEQSESSTLKCNSKDSVVKTAITNAECNNQIEVGPLLKPHINTEKFIAPTNNNTTEQSYDKLKTHLKIRMLEYLKLNYDIGSLLHNGKYSKIFKCKNPIGNCYAIKVIHDGPNYSESGFQKEKLLMTIQNDIPKANLNTIFVLNGFGMKGYWCFLLEYYPKNLRDTLNEQRKPFHIDMVQRLSKQLVSAIILLRNNNIVHSNIKPGHILLDASLSKLKVCGFDEMHVVTNKHMYPNTGTSNYRAPEIILGCPEGFSIDVWSTALVMYEMATNRKLFPGTYNNDILYKQLCTLGQIPLQMLKIANFQHLHFCGNRFMRRVGPAGKDVIFVDNFFGSSRILATLKQAHKKCGGDETPQVRKQAVKKYKMFHTLIESMLELNPVNRLPIEFVYANSFICGSL